jgi:glycosyltransferase involved in cell wall biosynthesis
MQDRSALELTILIPCLNEAKTLSTCIRQANVFLRTDDLVGEIVVADNRSVDGSHEIASAEGAKTVLVQTRGYGAAVLGEDNGSGRFIRDHGRRGRVVRFLVVDAFLGALENRCRSRHR